MDTFFQSKHPPVVGDGKKASVKEKIKELEVKWHESKHSASLKDIVTNSKIHAWDLGPLAVRAT